MQVKKFEAPTMQEALRVIKRELGPDAIILSTKQNRSGFGLMSKASVEVTAAIAEKDMQKKAMAEKGLPQEVKEKIWNSKANTQAEIYDNYFERQLKQAGGDKVQLSGGRKTRQLPDAFAKPEERARQNQAEQRQQQQQRRQPEQRQQAAQQVSTVAEEAPKERRYADILDDEVVQPQRASRAQAQPQRQVVAEPVRVASDDRNVQNLERDIEQLKAMIQDLTLSQSQSQVQTQSSGASARVDQENSGLTAELNQTMQDLVTSGIEKRLARELVRNAAFDLSSMDQHDESAILDRVAQHLMQDIQVKDLLEGVGARAGNAKTTVIALVGPTGVGKTTTIAKIASLGVIDKRLRVGLINLDSYKVAAADQLSTYARIMSIPFRSVNTKEELSQAIYDFSSLDLVLIDTTGRSQKDQESLLQLRHLLGGIENCQTALMMSATTKDSDMNDVVSRFKLFNPAGIVFSKLDETSVYGCIYNTQKKTALPLLYFTVGQRVPEDIEKASAERVVDLILDL